MHGVVLCRVFIIQVQKAHGAGQTSLDLFRELVQLRKREPSFRWGDFKASTDGDNEANVYYHTRRASGFPAFLVVANVGRSATVADLVNRGRHLVVIPPTARVVIASTVNERSRVGGEDEFRPGSEVALGGVYLQPGDVLVLTWNDTTAN